MARTSARGDEQVAAMLQQLSRRAEQLRGGREELLGDIALRISRLRGRDRSATLHLRGMLCPPHLVEGEKAERDRGRHERANEALAVSHRAEEGEVARQQEEPQRAAQREDERARAPGQGLAEGQLRVRVRVRVRVRG